MNNDDIVNRFANTLQNYNTRPSVLYGKKKSDSSINKEVKVRDVLTIISKQLRAIKNADSVGRDVRRSKTLCLNKKPDIVPVNLTPVEIERNSTNKFETQCILDTQLINLIENEEAAINLKDDIKKTDIVLCQETKNNDFQRNNVIRKCNNKPDAPLTFIESVDFKTSKNMSVSKEIQMNNAVNSHCNENNYKALEDGYENRITNNSINDNDVFNDSHHSFDYKLEAPSSPILGIKPIPKLQPLIYTLEEFDKFESLAAPVLNGNTDFEDAKRIINSQLKSADLFVKTHSEIVTTGKDVESVDSTDLFVNTQSGIVTTGKKIQSVDGTDLFVNTLSEMVTARKDIESDDGTEIFGSTHSEIISSDKEIKSIAGTIKNETKIVNNIPKTQYSFDINSGINNNVIEDEILFDSDDDIKYSEELPLTCALETSFYNNTQVLDKTMYVGFQTASNQSIQVLSDSFKKAKTVFDNVTKTVAENLSITELVEAFDRKTSYETDDLIKKNNKNDTEIIRTSKSITPEIYDKEENPNLHKNTTKKQTTEHIDEHIMKEFENNLMLCEDNATIESTCKRKMKNFCHEIGSYSKNYVEKDILEISVDKNNLNRNSFPNLIGFKTASNKKIKISHQALTKTKNIFDDIDLNNLESEIVQRPKETNNSFVGFKTANNKIIKISAEAVLKTKKIFDNIDTEYSVNCQTVENLPSIKQNRLKTEPILNGFGNSVSLNMEKSASFPAKETELEDVISTKINKIDSHGIQHKVANPLKTANNKTEVSSDNRLEKNCKIPVDIEEDNFQNGPEVEEIENKLYETKEEIENNLYPVNKKTCLSFKGFKTANNETINISAEALLKTKKVFQDIENKNMLSDDGYTIKSYMSQGFKTANKKPVVVSQEALSKPNIGQDVKKKKYKENLALSQGNTVQDSFDFPKFDGISKTDILKQSCFGGFQTASNKNVQISEEALIKSKKIFEDIDLYKNKDTYESHSQFKGFCTASNKKVNISEEALVKTGKIFENLSDDNRYCEDELKKNIRAKLKNNVNIIIRKPDTHKSKKILIHEENKITESKIHVEEYLNTEMIKIFDESLNTEDFFKETTPKSKRSGSPILSCSRNKKKKFQAPKSFYKIIHPDNKNIKPLNLFKFDENYKKSKKYKLTDIVTEKSLNSFENIDSYLFNFNFDRLLDFRFENNRNEIDSDSWTTYKIKNYFTDSVNKKIIPDGWIDNHLKLIIWKLISYEMISPSYMKYACSVKNVLQQLKYRYDRELYNVERPALRKILEKDDVSTKFMILCVASFYVDGVSIVSFTKENKNIELLLTDGWYCVTASADSMIDKLIIDGKISIGTKLAIYGAELTNCEQGISPLEDTSAVRLKISGNSIKRAKWDARLGFHGNGAMMSRLKTVKLEGGKISKLRVFVTRVYPTMYVEKFEDGSTVTRSERLEHLHQMKCETEKQIQMEKLYDEVVKMTEQDTDDSEEQYREQENLDTGSQISRLMKKSKDPIEFKSTLTKSQTHMLNEHMNRQNEKLMENIQKKAQILIKKRGLDITRNVVPLMKVRVFDEKKAMITIWRPNESLFDLIKEGAWIDVYNVVPTSIRYSEIQISAGRQSIFCKSKFKEIDRLRALTQIFKRNCYTIKDLQSSLTTDYNEVDTVGIVFLIEPKNYDGSKELFQNVYFSGTDKSIISVNFWGGVKKFGFENILEVGQIVACVNLQKRAGNTRYILQYRATEYTYFTKTPKYDLAKKLLEELSAKFVKMDKNKMIQDCIDLKNNYLNFKYSNTENVSPYRMNNSEYNISRNKMFIESPLLDKDFNSNLGLESNFKNRELSPNLLLRKKKANEKIAKLTEYGEPPPLNHIHIINKSSKVVQPYKSPLISDISPSVANTNYININNVTSTSNKISSPVLNRTFVKINPVKLNFALEENNIAEELNSPPLSLDLSK